MKKIVNIKFILFLFFVFFFININVKGVTEEEIDEIQISLSKGSNACVYSTESLWDINGDNLDSPFKYVIVVFNKKDENNGSQYNIEDYTLKSLYYNYKTTIKIIDGEVITGYVTGSEYEYAETNDCSKYFVQVDYVAGTEEYNIYLTKDIDISPKPDYYYEYDSEKTNSLKIIEGIKVDCTFDLKINNAITERHQIISFDPKEGLFGTSANENVCPATTVSYGVETGYIFTRIPIDISTFKCSEWKLADNRNYFAGGENQYSECRYFLVDKDEDIVAGEGSVLEEEGTYVTRYVLLNSSNKSISIVKNNEDGSFKAILKTKKEETKIDISNINDYKSDFASDDKGKYPKYIIKDGENYSFSEKSGSGFTTTYINISRLSSLANLGDGATIDECEDLFSSSFLEFLDNNVIKIIYIGIPILLIFYTTFDFAKVVFINDKEGIQGAAKKFGKRAIAAVLIYLIPTILVFLTRIFVANDVAKCVEEFKNMSENSN